MCGHVRRSEGSDWGSLRSEGVTATYLTSTRLLELFRRMELRAHFSIITGERLDLTGLALACIFLGVPPKVIERPRFLEACAAKQRLSSYYR